MARLFPAYRRLLQFAWPYRQRLLAGIVAGVFAGGSIFGVLSFLPTVVSGLDRSAAKVQHSQLLTSLAERFDLRLIEPDTGAITLSFMLLAIVWLVGAFLVKALANYANRYYMRWVGARVILDLRNAMYAALHRQSLRFYGRSDVGQLISSCINDTASVERSVSATVADLTSAPIELFAAAAAVIFAAWKAGIWEFPLAIFIVMPICFVPIIVLARRIKRHYKHALERISDLVSRMHETLTAIRIVKAFHMETRENRRFDEINHGYFRQVMKALRAELMMSPLMEFVAVFMICVLIFYCRYRGIAFAEITPILAAAVLSYGPIKRLAQVNAELQRSMAGAERIFALLDTHDEICEAPNPVRASEFRESIVFENLTFAYDAHRPPVVRDIDLTIRKGQVVAFVGATGSGKTTLASLLARFFDPSQGRILLDGIDLRQYEIASLRHLIGIVTQETLLFNDTIAYNIAYGATVPDQARIEAAARQANAHEFILAQEGGYQRVIGEKGAVLSGGQRQRLAIARAIYHNPAILILDEATSALDTVTEQLVQDALNQLMRDRTVFAIAHRLSTVMHADRIYVMDEGRIVEQGTHQELYAANGRYRRLCDMQFAPAAESRT